LATYKNIKTLQCTLQGLYAYAEQFFMERGRLFLKKLSLCDEVTEKADMKI